MLVRKKPKVEENSGYYWFSAKPDEVVSWGGFKVINQKVKDYNPGGGGFYIEIEDVLTKKRSYLDSIYIEQYKSYGLLQ